MKAITKISSFVKEAIQALDDVAFDKPKYVYVSHVYRDTLKKANQLKEIDKLEKTWGVKIIFT